MKNSITIWVTLAITVIDQLIKSMIRRIPNGDVIWRISGFLEIRHSENDGAAFSMLAGKTDMLTVLSMILLMAVIGFAVKGMHLTRPARIYFAFLVGGGLGNLIDRLLFGSVTDYIRVLFFQFPVFNFADIAITCSIAALMILLLADRLEEHTGEEHGSNR